MSPLICWCQDVPRCNKFWAWLSSLEASAFCPWAWECSISSIFEAAAECCTLSLRLGSHPPQPSHSLQYHFVLMLRSKAGLQTYNFGQDSLRAVLPPARHKWHSPVIGTPQLFHDRDKRCGHIKKADRYSGRTQMDCTGKLMRGTTLMMSFVSFVFGLVRSFHHELSPVS